MAGIVVEYARFVDVQQRRRRIVTELRRPSETGAPAPAASHASDRIEDASAAPARRDAPPRTEPSMSGRGAVHSL